VVREAAAAGALVFHTLVAARLRRLMLEECRLHGVDAMDLMGPLLDRLAWRLKFTPREKPGLFKQLSAAKSRQIEAVDYAFHHDDGQNPDGLGRAEILLVGVSRTMKTPTMLYLAYRGWFAANVPLVPELPLPAGLLAHPPQQVFCLLMAADRLLELRRTRASQESIPAGSYATREVVRKELAFADALCMKHGWWRIDVTGKSVEELGQEIIALRDKEPGQ
jgi:regulator of PEP synthase PpsR (kinase-PPPase family)